MAISASTVWECRASGASDNNGGGFVAGSGGTDSSQQNAAQVAVGGGVVTSSITTTVVTFTGSTYTVLAGDVGNIVQFISGTNVTAGFYQITSVGAGLNGTWTLDRTPLTSGTTTNAVANMGGALASLSKLSGAMVASNKAFCTGAFTSTATITFAQTVTSTASAPATRLIGYGAARGDSTHATLTLQTNTGLTGISGTGNAFNVEQVDVDCGSLGTSTGINMTGSNCTVVNCKVANFTTRGINLNVSQGKIRDCEVTGGAAGATVALEHATSTGGMVLRCFVHDNACPGVLVGLNCTVAFCLIVNNSGAASDGLTCNGNDVIANNTIHNNGRHGIIATGTVVAAQDWKNNLLTSNGGFGLVGSPGTAIGASSDFDGNAFWNNTSGARSLMDSTAGIFGVNPYTNVRDVTLSVSPYVGPTTGSTANFALNNTAGGGAACRSAGSPGTFLGNTGTTGSLSMGAVQSAGSGVPSIIMATG